MLDVCVELLVLLKVVVPVVDAELISELVAVVDHVSDTDSLRVAVSVVV
jgi:hypothetical protein